MEKRGKDMRKLDDIINALLDGCLLPVEMRDHPLIHNLAGFRDCHIETDWVLIYAIKGNDLALSRTGTHADILDE
jgi:mRNA interferase YafQ